MPRDEMAANFFFLWILIFPSSTRTIQIVPVKLDQHSVSFSSRGWMQSPEHGLLSSPDHLFDGNTYTSFRTNCTSATTEDWIVINLRSEKKVHQIAITPDHLYAGTEVRVSNIEVSFLVRGEWHVKCKTGDLNNKQRVVIPCKGITKIVKLRRKRTLEYLGACLQIGELQIFVQKDYIACPKGKQKGYRGNISFTKDGEECLYWAATTAFFAPNKYPNSGLDENFCRNPEDKKAWCFVRHLDFRWSYCDVCRIEKGEKIGKQVLRLNFKKEFDKLVNVKKIETSCKSTPAERKKLIDRNVEEKNFYSTTCDGKTGWITLEIQNTDVYTISLVPIKRNKARASQVDVYYRDYAGRWKKIGNTKTVTGKVLIFREHLVTDKIKLQKTSDCLGFTEIYIHSSGGNFAIGKPTRQSSTQDISPEVVDHRIERLDLKYHSEKAVDGSDVCGHWSLSCTKPEDFSWWCVDLGEPISVDKVEISEVKYLQQWKYTNKYLTITVSMKKTTPSRTRRPSQLETCSANGKCSNRIGRHVCITKDGKKERNVKKRNLCLCEVAVYGRRLAKCLGEHCMTLHGHRCNEDGGYRGNLYREGYSGRKCLDWDTIPAWNDIHGKSEENRKKYSLDKNFCRVANRSRPWCYIEMPSLSVPLNDVWEWCNVPDCDEEADCVDDLHFTQYMGRHHRTADMEMCTRWDKTHQKYSAFDDTMREKYKLLKNYCRQIPAPKSGSSQFVQPVCYKTTRKFEKTSPDPCNVTKCSDLLLSRNRILKIMYANREISGDNSLFFDRVLADYKKGFGPLPLADDPVDNFWMGLDFLEKYLKKNPHGRLLIEVLTENNKVLFGIWEKFELEGEKYNYALNLGRYHTTSTLPDYFRGKMEFRAKDNTHPTFTPCIRKHLGGWWFKQNCNSRELILTSINEQHWPSVGKLKISQMSIFYHGMWSDWKKEGGCNCGPGANFSIINLQRFSRKCDSPSPVDASRSELQCEADENDSEKFEECDCFNERQKIPANAESPSTQKVPVTTSTTQARRRRKTDSALNIGTTFFVADVTTNTPGIDEEERADTWGVGSFLGILGACIFIIMLLLGGLYFCVFKPKAKKKREKAREKRQQKKGSDEPNISLNPYLRKRKISRASQQLYRGSKPRTSSNKKSATRQHSHPSLEN